LAATINGALVDGPISGLDEPDSATMLLQFAGEFADPKTKQRIWDAAEEHIAPTWNRDAGEFTLGFGLDEPYPRGQLKARAMAGWVCKEGDWTRIFNAPNLVKFDQPTVIGVDFPRVALSEARWDGTALHLAAHPQNTAVEGSRTKVRITNVASAEGWVMIRSDGTTIPLSVEEDHIIAELTVDNEAVVVRPGESS